MKNLPFFIILLVFCSNSVRAVGLEQIQINSYINEPLNASIVIFGVDEFDLADVKFSVASQSDYKRLLGTARPAYLNKVNFNIVAIDNDRHEVQITSTRRVREPILNFLLKITERQSSFIKKLTLLMDPKIDPAKFLTNAAKPIALTEETLPRKSPKAKSAPEPAVERKQIKVGDRSISIIAQNSALHEKFSVYQIMRAFYLENPQAFERGNIDKLKSGASLFIPPESLIGELSRGQAINFVYSVSKDNVTKPVSTSTANRTDASLILPALQGKLMGESNAQESLHQPSTNKESVKAALGPLSESMQQDIKSWRGVADEFAAISQLLKSHNQSMQSQNDELISMANILHKQNQQIFQLRLRLNELTATQQTDVVGNIDREQLANSVTAEQQGIVADHESFTELVKRELIQINSEIAKLKSELAVLPENNPSRISKPLPAREQPAQFEATSEIKAPEPVAASAQVHGDFSKLWITLIVIGAVSIFALQEWAWRRRFRMLHQAAVDEKIEAPPLNETPPADESISRDAAEIELRDFSDERKKTAKSAATVDKPRFSSNYQTVDEVKLECDTLIAYELYSEALQLVQASRDKLGNDPWLDIKELEILASSGQCDEFFARFDEYKQRLELEQPDPWKEVEKLHNQLRKDFKITTVR